MTRFRPCIDLHAGQVKQIVGGTLTTTTTDLKTNFTSKHPASYYANLYREHALHGAHVIMLGPGNDEAARGALKAWPGKLQVGGGINDKNAKEWIEAGADKVIITSYLFPDGKFSQERLDAVLAALGNDKSKLVIDLSCRRQGSKWFVAMNKWQTITEMEITKKSISTLHNYCCELLIHAADNEGLQAGIDTDLVSALSQWLPDVSSPDFLPITYAGGASTIADLDLVRDVSGGKVDLTIGSALDVFGGKGCTFAECVEWNLKEEEEGR